MTIHLTHAAAVEDLDRLTRAVPSDIAEALGLTPYEGGDTLRHALTALRPHLPDPKADHLSHLGRIHVHVEPFGLVCVASNGVTAAMALVDTTDLADGEVGTTFNISPDEAKELLGLFRIGKASGGGDNIDSAVRIQITNAGLVITDVSGLFPGRQATFPRHDGDPGEYPDVALVIAAALNTPTTEHPLADPDVSARFITNGALLAVFATASRTYKAPLVARVLPGSRPRLVVTIGEAFAGLLSSSSPSSEEHSTAPTDTELAWLDRSVRMTSTRAADKAGGE